MFDNVVLPLKYQNDLDMYGHTIGSVLNGNNLIPVFTALLIFVLFISLDVWEWIRHYCFQESWKEELESVEGLPEFPRCMNSTQLDHFIKEEEMIR